MKKAKICALFLTAAVALLLATCSEGIEKEEFATVTISLGNSEASRILVWKGDNDFGGEIPNHTYELTIVGRNMSPIRLTRKENTLTGSGVPIGRNLELEIRAYMTRDKLVSLADQLRISLPNDAFTDPKILRAIGRSNPVTISAGNNTIASVNLYSAMEVSNWKELKFAAYGERDGDRWEAIFLKGNMDATETIEIKRSIFIWAESDITISRDACLEGPFFSVVAQNKSTGSLTIGATPELDAVDLHNGAITLDGKNTECNYPLIISDGDCTIGTNVTLRNNTNYYHPDYPAGTFGGGVYIYDGTFTLYGRIEKNTALGGGGGVAMFGGNFVMKDGAIIGGKGSGNRAIIPDGGIKSAGGGVITVGGNFTMEAGAIIEGNESNYGGGVGVGAYYIDDTVVSSATFKMNDGAIIRGNVSDYGAGGVVVAEGTFNMFGGSITGNTCKTEWGIGGVLVGGVLVGGINTSPSFTFTAAARGTFNMFKLAKPGPDGSIKGNTGGIVNNFYIGKETVDGETVTGTLNVDGENVTANYDNGW
jgi:hypothetical protein